MKKRKNVIIPLIVVLGSILLIVGGTRLVKMKKYKKAINTISIQNVDLSNIKDGTYTGAFSAVTASAEVSVTVEDNKITKIDILKHEYDWKKAKKAENVIKQVVKKDTLEVDTISGATASSKIILKAISNALKVN
ncbi:FMN-binding protein [Clostridium sediminicola]|uniref:FMN-binding protein n=1 Tax=Clostridium sediminicola TaxID=3114879 RepID=UPI0031F1D79D